MPRWVEYIVGDTYGTLSADVLKEPELASWLQYPGNLGERGVEIGGLVEMEWGPCPLVEDDDPLFTILDHFKNEVEVIRVPSTDLVVDVLENAVAGDHTRPAGPGTGRSDRTSCSARTFAPTISVVIPRDRFPGGGGR